MDSAAIPSVDPPGNRTVSSLFAALPKWAGERRKVIRISGDAISGYTSEVVKDYDQLYSGERAAIEAALEQADADDSPEAQQYLMQAWTAMAMYLANADDEDKTDAMTVLQMIGSMVNDPDDGSSSPNLPSAFNASRRSEGAAAVKCPQCQRAFATPAGLSNHMKTVHTKSGKGETPTAPGKK